MRALQVICACLLTKEEVTLSNVPEILDVLKLIELLQGWAYRSDTLHMENLSSRLRISILIISKRKIFIIKRSVEGVYHDSRATIGSLRVWIDP